MILDTRYVNIGLFSIDRQDKNYSRHITNGAKVLKKNYRKIITR